jgi:hypothetical protein
MDTNAFYRVTLDSSYILPSKNLGENGKIGLDLATNNGPGFSGTLSVEIFSHTADNKFIDTVSINYTSDPLPAQLTISPSSEIMFYTLLWHRVDTTITLDWTKFVDSVSIIKIPNDDGPTFGLYSPIKTGRHMTMGVFCYPPEGPYPMSSEIFFAFRERSFNHRYTWFIGEGDRYPWIYLNWDFLEGANANVLTSENYVYPNPFTSKFTISLNIELPTVAEIELFNAAGISVQKLRKELNSQKNNIEIDAQSLPPGVFWFIIRSRLWSRSGKIIKL